MRIELRSQLREFSFAVVCLVLVGLYLHLALRPYRASRWAAIPDLSNLQEAIRLEPSNAEYRELLGRSLALSGTNLNDAIASYRTAVHLNRYVARYWLDLAGAYQVAGQTSEQERSVEQAVEADPTTPHVAWEAANFFLVQGSREAEKDGKDGKDGKKKQVPCDFAFRNVVPICGQSAMDLPTVASRTQPPTSPSCLTPSI